MNYIEDFLGQGEPPLADYLRVSPENEPGFPLLPITDTCTLFEGLLKDGLSALTQKRADGFSLNVPGIADDWIAASDAAIEGYTIARQGAENGVVSADTRAINASLYFSLAFQEIPFEKHPEMVERVKRVFQFLKKPSPQEILTEEDIDAVQMVLAEYGLEYQPREIPVHYEQ